MSSTLADSTSLQPTQHVVASPSSAFFYGTLMHPAVIRRVIRNDGLHLQMCSAILYVSTSEFSRSEVLNFLSLTNGPGSYALPRQRC